MDFTQLSEKYRIRPDFFNRYYGTDEIRDAGKVEVKFQVHNFCKVSSKFTT